MGEAKRSGKRKTPKTSSALGPSSKKSRKQSTVQKQNGRRPTRPILSPLEDTQLASVAGIPDQALFNEVSDHLNAEDRDAFAQTRRLLAEHLGSHAAARLWLVSPGTGFETTALDAVRKGQAKVVLGTLMSQWGQSPSYA